MNRLKTPEAAFELDGVELLRLAPVLTIGIGVAAGLGDDPIAVMAPQTNRVMGRQHASWSLAAGSTRFEHWSHMFCNRILRPPAALLQHAHVQLLISDRSMLQRPASFREALGEIHTATMEVMSLMKPFLSLDVRTVKATHTILHCPIERWSQPLFLVRADIPTSSRFRL